MLPQVKYSINLIKEQTPVQRSFESYQSSHSRVLIWAGVLLLCLGFALAFIPLELSKPVSESQLELPFFDSHQIEKIVTEYNGKTQWGGVFTHISNFPTEKMEISRISIKKGDLVINGTMGRGGHLKKELEKWAANTMDKYLSSAMYKEPVIYWGREGRSKTFSIVFFSKENSGT